VDDPVGLAYWDGYQLEQAAGAIRADHQHSSSPSYSYSTIRIAF
jgi:hypothetical protein